MHHVINSAHTLLKSIVGKLPFHFHWKVEADEYSCVKRTFLNGKYEECKAKGTKLKRQIIATYRIAALKVANTMFSALQVTQHVGLSVPGGGDYSQYKSGPKVWRID